jgi:DNA-binding HxlR family transcriptional regulator
MLSSMARRRSYHQFCGVARALDVVGERWSLLIVRNLLLGPRRYSDLLAELPGLTTNLLAKRLKEMEAAGLLAKTDAHPPHGPVVYDLTAAGAALEPVVMELGRWGGRLMDRPRARDRVDLGLALLALKRRYRGGATMTVGIDAGSRAFSLRFTPDRLVVRDRPAEDPSCLLEADTETLRALFAGAAAADELRAAGKLRVVGPARTFAALLSAVGARAS